MNNSPIVTGALFIGIGTIVFAHEFSIWVSLMMAASITGVMYLLGPLGRRRG